MEVKKLVFLRVMGLVVKYKHQPTLERNFLVLPQANQKYPLLKICLEWLKSHNSFCFR